MQAGQPLTAACAQQGLSRSECASIIEGSSASIAITDIEWARIPHFYRAFYVYQYSTGFCSAVTIADKHVPRRAGDARIICKFLITWAAAIIR